LTEQSGWIRTSPLAVIFFVGRFIKALAQNALQSFAPFVAFLLAYDGGIMSKLVLATLVLVVVSLAVAIAKYWFFRYRITDDAVLIREGIFQKKQLDIKFRRIQGISTEQNIVYRLFGLVTISFDTAGSSGSESALPAIHKQLAEQLQGRIVNTETEVMSTDVDLPPGVDAPLLTLDWRDMIRIGLSDPRALIVLALLIALYEKMSDTGKQIIEDYASLAAASLGGFSVATGIMIAVALVLTTAMLLALVSIVVALLRYHRFELHARKGRLQTIGGLLTRHTSTMDVSKIQVLQLRQGILFRLFGRWRAVLRQASSGRQHESVVVPIVDPAFAPTLNRLAFAPELQGLGLDPQDPLFRRISVYFMRARIFFLGLFPAVIACGLAWPDHGKAGVLFLLWLPFLAACVFTIWRRHGFQIHEEGMVIRSGFIGFHLDVFLFRKVQRVTVSQSWLQERRDLAAVRIYLASGSVRLRYINHSLACQLRDHILYKIETSQHSWH